MYDWKRWRRAAAAAMLATGIGLATASTPAQADTVAEDLITVLEETGQLTPEKARELREKARIEREALERQIREEVQVQADRIERDVYTEFEEVGSGEKAVAIADKAESLKIGGYVHFLGQLSDNSTGVHDASGNRSSAIGGFETSDFRETDGLTIRRARIKLSGNIGPRTKYVLQFDGDGIDDPDEDDALNINDAYAEYHIGDALAAESGFASTWLRVGQFKAPFSKEQLTSSSQRITIARSHFVNELTPARELGVMVYNDALLDGRLGLWGGAFNGTGENEDDNDPFLVAARGEFQVLDGRETRWGVADWYVGGAILGSTDGNGVKDPLAGGLPPGSAGFTIVDPIFVDGRDGEVRYRGDRMLYTLDTELSVGRAGVIGEILWADYDVRDSLTPTPGAGDAVSVGSNDWALADDQSFMGYHIMPYFWLIEDTLQAVFKYEYVDYDNVLDASMWATTLGLNWHLLPDYRSVVRVNWAHLEHETDVVTAGRDDDLDQDFFLTEWQVKF